jgi:hypothetical protein
MLEYLGPKHPMLMPILLLPFSIAPVPVPVLVLQLLISARLPLLPLKGHKVLPLHPQEVEDRLGAALDFDAVVDLLFVEGDALGVVQGQDLAGRAADER